MAKMNIGVILKRKSITALNTLDRFYHFFKGRVTLYLDEAIAPTFPNSDDLYFLPEKMIPSHVSFMLVLGGDGTFLHAASLIPKGEIPILGVNLGYLGFLTETSIEQFYPMVEQILSGHVQSIERHRLKVTVTREDGSILERNLLNDAVFNSGAIARMIQLSLRSDGKEITTYRADGLIFATSTGSTAYALSAGGPIIHPTLNLILVAPICPHTLTMRPLVLPAETPLSVEVKERRSEVYLTLDGQEAILLDDTIQSITVEKSKHPIRLITSNQNNYYKILRNKLKWSGVPLD